MKSQLLVQLATISENASVRSALAELAKTEAQRKAEQAKFDNAMNHLSERLIAAAQHEPSVRRFQVYHTLGMQDMDDELYKKVNRSGKGNAYCAWRDKVMTEQDILTNMKGVFRKVYEACEKMGLEPKTSHWWDGAENDGFEIYITW